ncbi:MAG TPA: aconitase/3-isopropylmalate dehydratase large subunit family protein [Synergistaceae bacterium]|nr:aconitase/3-isopropylmalate dehydratase large subunit family protein [Synergistaceae bacterium]HQF91011.1 aconitase/3-isopropylmalate dehydratase large subunit family protein [Synergistaceae bacterium]HQH77780.1 aconitase/3-isopropylmalate dehydratase large subunit family protein [Synergistaceae bacterium]HQK24220.1 aconitase/3-isopropylmalate dehydratase large subunit family protein [Synergistaceae bacterium]
MGKTMIEKIIERASGKQVKVGDRVWCHMDLSTARDFGGANCTEQFDKVTDKKGLVWDPDKIAFTFDLQAPAHSEGVAKNQKTIRDFAKRQGISKVFDINWGIGQHVLLENGLVKPGDVILGTDSHMNLLGAVGAFATGVGNTDIVASWFKGTNWFRVPESMKITATGTFGKGVCMRDYLTYLVGRLGADGMSFRSVEFDGPVIENANLAERITLCSMVTEMDGKIGLILPNGEVLDWLRSRAGEEVIERTKMITPDADATYVSHMTVDVSSLEPLASCPDAPDNVKPVREVAGTPINQVHIGSCSNGRFEDIAAAFDILKAGGFTVSPSVRTIITPSTREVMTRCAEAGMIQKFLEAGVVFTNPTCSLCTAEHYGVLPSGDVGVSTTNRNFIGKVGKGSNTYLMSPMSAMAAAVRGVITDPRDLLR